MLSNGVPLIFFSFDFDGYRLADNGSLHNHYFEPTDIYRESVFLEPFLILT
jgi:hypothetical protein